MQPEHISKHLIDYTDEEQGPHWTPAVNAGRYGTDLRYKPDVAWDERDDVCTT
jgi:hypothetical protein